MREWFKENGGPVILILVTLLAVSFVWWCAFRDAEKDKARRRALPPPQVSIQEPEAVLLASPLWMDEQSKFTKRGGTVYLIEVKGHKLAVVISDRGAGICELREETNHE